jgi:ribokinase
VLQNEIPEAANIAAAKAARRGGAAVVFNAAPARTSSAELLDLVDVLVVNRVEAEMLSGLAVSDRQGAIAALASLGAGRRTVIVTLGGGGLVAAQLGKAAIEIEALPVTAVSTHGAGDCFVGALAARLAAGEDVVVACRFANLAAGNFVSAARREE